MFDWLRNFVSRRAAASSAAARRDIFRYWDGRRWQTIDPLPVWFAVCGDKEFSLKEDLGKAMNGDPEAMMVVQSLVNRLFNVQPYDGRRRTGLTVAQVIWLLADFIGYMLSLKKKHEPSPTKSPPTDSTSSGTPPASTTPPVADSCSTAAESTAAAPTPSS